MGKVLKGRDPLRVSKEERADHFPNSILDFWGRATDSGCGLRTVGSERLKGRDANSPQPTIQKCV
jgi:hypothetical protein